MATNFDDFKNEMYLKVVLVDEGTDKSIKTYTNKDFLLQQQERILNVELKPIGCANSPCRSIVFQPTVTGKPVINVCSQLVDIATLTQSMDKSMGGKYLLCRTISLPMEIVSTVVVVVDDPEGNLAVRMIFERFYAELLPVGTIMVVQNPSFETSDVGYALQCKTTCNVTFLNQHQCQQFFPDITWKGEIPKEHRLAVDEKTKPETAEDWKILGNKYFTEKNYYASIDAYTSGLQLDAQHVTLLSNRSAAYMQISAFNMALNDANEVLNIDPHHVKSIYRKGKALCGLKKYEEAMEIVVGMESIDLQESDRKAVIKFKSNIRMFLHQQKTGDYDITVILKTANANSVCRFDYADYVGPVEVRDVPGKGRGLFVTKDVKPGQLIIGSKAFAMYQSGSVVPYNKIPGCIGVSNEGMKSAGLNIARKLMMDPEIGKELYHLYAGPELKFLDHDQQGDNTFFVDRKRIENICDLNSFGAEAPGLWLLPSYINHSCFDCNCNWIIFGDFILIRALKPIAKDDEVQIAYVLPDQYSIRMVLFGKHGFSCDCKLCEMDEEDSEEVHDMRSSIMQKCEKLLTRTCTGSGNSTVLQKFVDKMASLRSSKPEMNIYAYVPMTMLYKSLLIEGQFLRAATVMENLYNMSKQTTIFYDIRLSTAAGLALTYLRIEDLELGKKWFETLTEGAIQTYGSCSEDVLQPFFPNVNIFETSSWD